MQDNAVAEFQQGNRQSFRLLFDTLYPVMCLFAKKFVNNLDEAEDIVQEVFVELWNQHAKFESFNQIKAFMYLSVKNKCFNFIKHQQVKVKYAISCSLDNTDAAFDEAVIEAEVVNNINDEINKLPEQQKQVILLSMQGLSLEEVADNMQISVNTVKMHKKLAYKQLREKISSVNLLLLVF
jgi:RNA polymerase sigma-70 factor (ECF subfamily)